MTNGCRGEVGAPTTYNSDDDMACTKEHNPFRQRPQDFNANGDFPQFERDGIDSELAEAGARLKAVRASLRFGEEKDEGSEL
jgi:hypothetical protein